MNLAPDCLPVGSRSHPRAGLTGWCLSLSLHGIVILALVWLAPLAVPAGGGGGSGQGSGAGSLCVDLAGLGTGCPVAAQPETQGDTAARTDDAVEAHAPAASPETPQADVAPPQPQPERPTVPVLKAQPKPPPRAVKRRQPHRIAPRQTVAPQAPRTAPAASPAKGETSGGAAGAVATNGSGPENAQPGGPPGAGGGFTGTGGGEGAGRGSGVGAGQGLGEADGMRLAAVDVKPRIARKVEPAYPEEARRQGIEGRVVARLLVTAQGSVARLRIVAAKPPKVFDQAVLHAVEKWRFHPARFKGRDVATWVMLPIRFDLKH